MQKKTKKLSIFCFVSPVLIKHNTIKYIGSCTFSFLLAEKNAKYKYKAIITVITIICSKEKTCKSFNRKRYGQIMEKTITHSKDVQSIYTHSHTKNKEEKTNLFKRQKKGKQKIIRKLEESVERKRHFTLGLHNALATVQCSPITVINAYTYRYNHFMLFPTLSS